MARSSHALLCWRLGYLDGLTEALLSRGLITRLRQQQFALESMQFRFLKPLIVFLHECECLVQGYARFSESTCARAAIRQHAQVIRKRQFGSRASVGFQPLLQQPKPLLQSALQQQTASDVERARCVPKKKPLFRRDPNLLVAGRLRRNPQSAMLVEPSRVMQCVFQTEGLIDGTRELEHLVVELQRFVRKTEVPQGQRQITAVSDAGILAHEPGPERRALAVVELGDRPRATVASPGKIAPIKPCQAPSEREPPSGCRDR